MRKPTFTPTLLKSVAVLFTACAASSACPQTRGELLYTTHCVACHTVQVHWRDKKVVTDGASLRTQVRRWQAAASLGWTEDDIADVVRYLNDSVYHLDKGADPLSSPMAN